MGGLEQNPVFLHIGAPKTGTTYIQTILDSAAPQLRREGFLFPAGKAGQQRASRDLLGRGSQRARQSRAGAWKALVRAVNEWPGPAVISNETLSLGIRSARIPKIVERFEGRSVQVVYTVRDLARQLPACWQEVLKNRGTTTFAEYFATVSGTEPLNVSRPGERIWAAQDAAAVLRPWAAAVGLDHIHLVTVPPRGTAPEALLQRFGSVLGVDLSAYSAVPREPNVSLDASEAAVLRYLNQQLGQADSPLSWPGYVRFVKRSLSNRAFPSRTDRLPIWLTPRQADWALEESRRVASDLKDSGYRVIGDLADLAPTSAAVPISCDDVDRPPETMQRDAAVLALARLLSEVIGQ